MLVTFAVHKYEHTKQASWWTHTYGATKFSCAASQRARGNPTTLSWRLLLPPSTQLWMSSIVSQPPQRLIVLIYWKPYGRESGRVSCLLKGNSDRPTDEQMMIPRRMANVLRGKSDILKYTCPVPTRACSWDGKSKLVNTHTHLCTKSNWHVVSCSLIFRARVRNWENKKWKVLGKWLTNTISNRSVGKNDLPLQNHSSRGKIPLETHSN